MNRVLDSFLIPVKTVFISTSLWRKQAGIKKWSWKKCMKKCHHWLAPHTLNTETNTFCITVKQTDSCETKHYLLRVDYDWGTYVFPYGNCVRPKHRWLRQRRIWGYLDQTYSPLGRITCSENVWTVDDRQINTDIVRWIEQTKKGSEWKTR